MDADWRGTELAAREGMLLGNRFRREDCTARTLGGPLRSRHALYHIGRVRVSPDRQERSGATLDAIDIDVIFI